MMRLFIAIGIPAEVKREIIESTNPLRKKFPQVNWIRDESLHLTLKFLGNINRISRPKDDQPLAENIKIGKNNLLAGIVLSIKKCVQHVKPFELEFGEIGFFDRGELIICLGMVKNHSLSYLVNSIEAELAKLGFTKEKREFNPHITIGRGRRLTTDIKERIKNSILNNKFTHIKNYSLSEISLIESRVTSKEATYTTVEKFSFSPEGV